MFLQGIIMTQIEEARKGNLTEAAKAVAEEEHVSPDILMGLVAEGKVVIPVGGSVRGPWWSPVPIG